MSSGSCYSSILAALPPAEPEIACGFCSPSYKCGNLDMKLLSLDHSASRWQSWASNLSLTPSCSLFGKTGIVAALFEVGVTGLLTHVYMWVAGQSEGIQEIEEDSAREFSEVHWCSTHRSVSQRASGGWGRWWQPSLHPSTC